MRKGLSILIFISFISGCASSTVDYRKPVINSIQNTKQVNIPFDKAWDILVRNLSTDFFVINNIDKGSRLINVSFSTNKPSDFIDCGYTKRTFSNLHGTQNYNYNTSDSVNYSITQGVVGFNIYKRSNLEGILNIYIAPESNRTLVTVNGKYVLNSNFEAVSFDNKQRQRDNLSFSFSTKSPYSDNNITCVSNGFLEDKILKMLND